ncbi:MAG: hypothetical protein AB7P76_00630 [Candidatus Melainabacteria bacterium]
MFQISMDPWSAYGLILGLSIVLSVILYRPYLQDALDFDRRQQLKPILTCATYIALIVLTAFIFSVILLFIAGGGRIQRFSTL